MPTPHIWRAGNEEAEEAHAGSNPVGLVAEVSVRAWAKELGLSGIAPRALGRGIRELAVNCAFRPVESEAQATNGEQVSATLISVVTVIYVAVALREGFGGRPEMAVVWSGYAFANLGLIWATMR